MNIEELKTEIAAERLVPLGNASTMLASTLDALLSAGHGSFQDVKDLSANTLFKIKGFKRENYDDLRTTLLLLGLRNFNEVQETLVTPFMPVSKLNLGTRTNSCLKAAGMLKVGHLTKITYAELAEKSGLGWYVMKRLTAVLRENGLDMLENSTVIDYTKEKEEVKPKRAVIKNTLVRASSPTEMSEYLANHQEDLANLCIDLLVGKQKNYSVNTYKCPGVPDMYAIYAKGAVVFSSDDKNSVLAYALTQRR